MAFIERIQLKNFLSFADAECRLAPFTLVVGPNNSGKTNFLRAFHEKLELVSHRNHPGAAEIVLKDSHGASCAWEKDILPTMEEFTGHEEPLTHARFVLAALNPIYRFDPDRIGQPEPAAAEHPHVGFDGEGATQVIERLQEEADPRFDTLVEHLRKLVPEIESVSLRTIPPGGKKTIMFQERGLNEKTPLSDVSDGTRLVLALLAAMFQPNPPPLLLIEDIDRALHPRLYEQLVDGVRQLVESANVQVIATTHNPYLIDYFENEPEAVVIVEKNEGYSTLANLDDRLAKFERVAGDEDEVPLGQMWFSGLVGGTPKPARPRKPAA
ncbi:MAG: putative ATPase [Verrucomicrobiales bacterium]|jgi:predicted ATPase